MSARILCVDDERSVLKALQRNLRKEFDITLAAGGKAALDAIADHGPFAVVLTDLRMPDIDGLELLKQVRDHDQHIVRMMLTGNNDLNTAIDAVNEGNVFRFLTKPCRVEILRQALQDALRQHQLLTAERELLERTVAGSVRLMSEVLQLVDAPGVGQNPAKRQVVRRLAKAVGHPERNAWELDLALMLHGIGRLTVPAQLFERHERGVVLDAREAEMIREVPICGGRLVANVPHLERVARIITYSGKNYDGGGKPADDVAGAELPLAARILRVVNDLFLLESRGYAPLHAIAEMERRQGHYDPELLAALRRECDAAVASAGQAAVEVEEVDVKQLRVGHVLLQDVVTEDNRTLLRAETAITEVLLERIRHFAILHGVRSPIRVRLAPHEGSTP